jgi:hypothetical protein
MPKVRKPRQLRLFALGGAWEDRFEAGFFRRMPRQPGVYFFYDAGGKLLYIGQSHDLRARVGSYRHVQEERHARRTLRLVHRVRRIEWEICSSAEEAIERERELLLKHRPPFNRAGVWQGVPWWIKVESQTSEIRLSPLREEKPAEAAYGPFRGGFPYVYASLVRLAQRCLRPELPMHDYPAGMLHDRRVAAALLRGDGGENVARSLGQFFSGNGDDFLQTARQLRETKTDVPLFEQRLWDADLELASEHYARHSASE